MAVLDLGGCPQAFSSCSDPWLLSSCSGQAHCNGFSSFGVWYKWISNSTKLFPNQYFKIKIKLQAWNWPQGLTPAAQEPPPRSRPFVGLVLSCAASLRTGSASSGAPELRKLAAPSFLQQIQWVSGSYLPSWRPVSMPADPTWSPSEKSGWSLLTGGVPSISFPPNPQATLKGWENQSDRPHTSNLFRTMNRGGGRVGTAVLTAAIRITWGFPGSSAGKESTCNTGDPCPITWVGNIPWREDRLPTPMFLGFPDDSDGKESACNAGDLGFWEPIPGLGRSPGGGHGNPLQYSCLKNPHGRRSLVGSNSWGHKKSDTTERLSAAQNHLEGN